MGRTEAETAPNTTTLLTNDLFVVGFIVVCVVAFVAAGVLIRGAFQPAPRQDISEIFKTPDMGALYQLGATPPGALPSVQELAVETPREIPFTPYPVYTNV